MKQLVKSIPINLVTPVIRESLPPQPIIGFVSSGTTNDKKGWVQPFEYHHRTNCQHKLIAVDGVVNGNQWREISGGINAVLDFLEKVDFQIFIFDTPVELFKWLAE